MKKVVDMKKVALLGSLVLVVGSVVPQPASVASTPFVIGQQVSNAKQPPKVELLNPGSEPRQALRFKPAVNAKQTAILTFNVDMNMAVAGKPMPKIPLPVSVLTVETVVTKVDPNGDIHYQFRYTNVDSPENASIPKPVMDAVRSQNKKMVGIGGSFVVGDRGQPKSGSFTIPDSVDAATRQSLEQLSQSISQFASPVPADAIGQGAQWQVTSPIAVSGINMTQTATYQLVSLQNGVATLDVNLKQQAQPQPLTQPGLPSGVSMVLKSFASQGQGKVTMRLDQILPLRSTISVQSSNEVSTKSSNAPGETTISTKSSMQMQIESKS